MDEITIIHTGLPRKVTISFFAISRSSKINRTHKHSNTYGGPNFHHKAIFFNAPDNDLYKTQ